MMGRSLSYSSGSSSGSSSSKDATSQRDRLLLEATQANLDVYRDERVKYCQGTDHVRALHHSSEYQFAIRFRFWLLTGGWAGAGVGAGHPGGDVVAIHLSALPERSRGPKERVRYFSGQPSRSLSGERRPTKVS
jgi:hypothetical protein